MTFIKTILAVALIAAQASAQAVSSKSGPALKDVNVNGKGNYGLGHCQGDCDSNSQCKKGLVCQERSGYTAIHGCTGKGKKDWDYCVKPADVAAAFKASATLTDVNVNGAGEYGLGHCQGDCDSNSQCKKGLVCQERSGYTAIRGCTGKGTRGWDYCVEPAHIAKAKAAAAAAKAKAAKLAKARAAAAAAAKAKARAAAAAKARADRIAKAKADRIAKAKADRIEKAKAAAAKANAKARSLAMKRCAVGRMYDLDFVKDCEPLSKNERCTKDQALNAHMGAQYMNLVCEKTCNILACKKKVANKHK